MNVCRSLFFLLLLAKLKKTKLRSTIIASVYSYTNHITIAKINHATKIKELGEKGLKRIKDYTKMHTSTHKQSTEKPSKSAIVGMVMMMIVR